VCEGQPVGSVGEEWVGDAVIVECRVNLAKPVDDVTGKHGITLNKFRQPTSFLFEREGGDTAEDQASDEEREPDTNGTKKFSFAFRLLRV
jgi:hypothetical protein